MKKKMLLALVVATMLTCLFAIGVGAEVTTYDDAPAKNNIQLKVDEIVEFDDGFKCPSYYVFTDDATIGDKDWSSTFSGNMDFTYINTKLGKTEENAYTYANVIGFDIPTGVTLVGKYAGSGGTTLEWVTFPNTVTTLGNAIFQSATGLKRCEMKFDGTNTLRQFPSYTFFGCSSLTAFSMPDCFTSLYDIAQFSGCKNMTAVHLSNNLVSWSSGGGGSRTATFDDCNNMYFVNESFTYDSIPEKPEVYYFPENLESITNQSVCRGCNNLNDVLVFGTKLTSMQNHYFFQSGPANKVVFLGDMTYVATAWWGTTSVYFCNPNDIDAESAGLDIVDEERNNATWSGTAYYCNAEGNTNHLKEKTVETEATCTLAKGTHELCYCGYAISSQIVDGSKPLGHSSDGATVVISYPKVTDANGNEVLNYFANAIHSYICQNEGCGKTITEEKESSALFTEKGYSKEENGNAFTYGISLNKTAESAYIKAGNKISYGFIIGAVPTEATGNIISADGTTTLENHIVVDFTKLTNEKLSIYNVRMFGLTDAQKATSVYCCAYVIDNENVYYIGENVTKTAVAVSYDAIPVTETKQ